MGLTRSSSGLLVFDAFGSDTEGDYTREGYGFSIGSGKLTFSSSNSASLRRTDISTAKCVTARAQDDADGSFTGYVGVGGSGIGTGTAPNGYRLFTNNGVANGLCFTKQVGGTATTLATNLTRRSIDTWYHYRLYIASGVVYARFGTTGLGTAVGNASDDAYTEGHIFLRGFNGTIDWDWFEGRTSHLITCTGMTEGHYLRVSDGTTAAEAAASGAGTASVDASAVLFPLASVQIRTASGGGGDLIAELDTGDHADMGGGDVFEYSGAAAATFYFGDRSGGLQNPFATGFTGGLR